MELYTFPKLITKIKFQIISFSALSGENTPLEAGLERFVKFDKDDFQRIKISLLGGKI